MDKRINHLINRTIARHKTAIEDQNYWEKEYGKHIGNNDIENMRMCERNREFYKGRAETMRFFLCEFKDEFYLSSNINDLNDFIEILLSHLQK